MYALGRYSYLEDMAFADGSPCRLTKAPAALFERTPNNNDGDIVNAATRWQPITDNLSGHPFFKGQADARASGGGVRARSSDACKPIVDEFGPTGMRFAGMVRPKR